MTGVDDDDSIDSSMVVDNRTSSASQTALFRCRRNADSRNSGSDDGCVTLDPDDFGTCLPGWSSGDTSGRPPAGRHANSGTRLIAITLARTTTRLLRGEPLIEAARILETGWIAETELSPRFFAWLFVLIRKFAGANQLGETNLQ